MTRPARLLMFGYLVASLCGFLETCSDLALAESAADLMRVEKEAFRSARDQEAANYYSKALEIENYYSKALEANPKLVEQQEEWVRARVKNGESADLLERIDPEFRGLSLPSRKDLIKKYHKELIIRASFIQQLVSDFNDFKVYRKGINIKNALIIGDLDFSRVEISPSVSISRSILFGEVDLRDTWFQNGLDWDGSHFLKAMKSGFLRVGRSALFSKVVFRGPVDFSGAKIAGVFDADEARFDSEADFRSLAADTALFSKSVFRGAVNFMLAKITTNFDASAIRFEDSESEARFQYFDGGKSSSFSNAVFRGPVDFSGAKIVSIFFAKKARFESKADFSSLNVGGDAVFVRAVFRGPVIFSGAKIVSRLMADNALFESQANFISLKLGVGASFSEAVFRGSVRFTGVNTAMFYASEARFESEANFSYFRVGDSALFYYAIFRGPVTFLEANISRNFLTNEARFESRADFFSLQVGGEASFNKTVFEGPVRFRGVNTTMFYAIEARFGSGANFNGLKVSQQAMFGAAVFRGPVDLSDANIGALHFERTKFREGAPIWLEGMTYKSIHTERAHYEEALGILSRMPHHHPQPYKQLESYYVEAGYKEWADAVFVEGKRRERETWTWGLWDWPTNVLKFIFLEKVVGYGRYLNRVLWSIVGFIVFGTFVFSRPRIFQDEKKLSGFRAFWYSLGLFLPFVRLGPEKFYRIDKEGYFSVVPSCVASSLPCWFVMRFQFSGEIYYYVHQLFGYILLSIGIIAIAGIIK